MEEVHAGVSTACVRDRHSHVRNRRDGRKGREKLEQTACLLANNQNEVKRSLTFPVQSLFEPTAGRPDFVLVTTALSRSDDGRGPPARRASLISDTNDQDDEGLFSRARRRQRSWGADIFHVVRSSVCRAAFNGSAMHPLQPGSSFFLHRWQVSPQNRNSTCARGPVPITVDFSALSTFHRACSVTLPQSVPLKARACDAWMPPQPVVSCPAHANHT